MIKALALCVLVNQVSHVVGKVTILRGPLLTYSNSRKLICFSEDDGGALMWNSNLIWEYTSYSFTDRKGDMGFRSVNEFNNDDIDCKMNAYDSCIILWDKHNWSLTNSFKTPMGPVFDQRWEDFKEYTNFNDVYDKVIIHNATSAALSFSVRVLMDLHMLLCHNEHYNEDFCYWIIIGGWGNRKSVIRRCANGVPEPGNYPGTNSKCAMEQVSLLHNPLSATEWRNFVITWNFMTRNISVYDTERVIMTYVDQHVNTEERTGEQLHVNYHAFIRSPKAMLLRFHIYDFLHTTVNGAILISPTFLFNKEKCIQLLVGLCAECDAEIVLRDAVYYEVLEKVTVKGSPASHGLPQWQFVKINKSLSEDGYTNMKIELTPKLNSASANPLWAIANVRQCPPHGCLRRGVMTAKQDWRKGQYMWPNVTCQKLFYDDHTVVSSVPDIDPAIELDEAVCPNGYIGPQCLISCAHQLESTVDCVNTAICHKDGCACSAGLSGPTCSVFCKPDSYGYGCKKKCGACLYKGMCNRVTGICDYGCKNTAAELYIPPLCQIGIQKLEKPVITSTDQKSIRAVVLINWRDEYENMDIFYFFTIKKMGGQSIQELRKRINQNTRSLIGYFENLESGTVYQIMCSLTVAQSQIDSDWETAETDCNPAKDFEVTPQETNLMIDWRNNEDQLYTCPPNWYHLMVKNTNTEDDLVDEFFTSFPYKLSYLTPYTSLTVVIRHKSNILFSKEVHTLEGVPSKVLDLRTLLLSNTQLTLFWMEPEKPNGKIIRYEVILKVEEYHGCRDLNLPTPTNHIITESTKDITITISQLHPYTSYNVEVTAHNSRHASVAVRTAFKTQASEIPAALFSQFRIQEWKLSWGPPEDCTTILGPIIAKVNIRGVSDAVKDFNQIKRTVRNILDLNKIDELYGAEWYEAKIYIVRDYLSSENISAYQKLVFETPPKAPPPVTNLEVIEVDTRESPAIIHLRWQSPLPPRNGQLRAYFVAFCNNKGKRCSYTEVQLDEYCDLWNGYICKTVREDSPYINVGAYNVNVTDQGLPTFVTEKMLDNMTPEAPWNYTFTINDHSVVDLKWMHPWRTGGHLQYFQILIDEVSSNLRKRVSRSSSGVKIHRYLVTNYTRTYNEQLYLLPSTQYIVSIQAVTIANKTSGSKTVQFRTPSTIDFEGELQVMAHESDSTVSLNIPYVVNDTSDSVTHIIVKGPNPCEKNSMLPTSLSEQAGLKNYDIAWQAAEISTNKLAGKPFTIGDDKMYGNVRNCPLKAKELYEIVIMITEQSLPSGPIMLIKRTSIRIGELPPKHYEAWLIPIILLLVVAGAAFYLYYRKRQKSIKQLMWQDEMILSQNFENCEQETKSAMPNSKQDVSTPSDRQSLSRATTPEVPPIVIGNNDEVKEMTSLVKVKDFEDYVRQAIQTGLLDKQYETFQRGQTRPWDYGKLPQNKSKNRYGNLVAYDETRVILKKLPDDSYSDYINANYITGYKKEKRYIATQGPKPSTVIDFWRMIWQEKVLIICMLANVIENGKTKCEQYWPDIGKKKKYGDIIVLNAKHNVFADYCFRTFHVTYGEETRKVEHLHYTAWPDHGVPLYTHSVMTYLKKLLATPPGNGPVVVHCSAGVGRTGTIVLCDICLHRAAAEGVVDVFAETASIRRERANMVDNKQQYLLAHLALVECLLTIPTTLPCNETLPTRIKKLKKELSVQQQRLQNTAWQDEALRPVTSPPTLSERNRAKNRFPELISNKVSRIYLKRYPASDEDSDYLSAVYVDGVKLQNQYLATQLPMPSTINDFWRMVAEFKVELILILQPPDSDDPTCCVIAPAKGEFKPTPYLNIIAKEIVQTEYYTSQKLLLIDKSEKPVKEQYVTILCSTQWKSGRNQPPPSVMTMVTFWQAAERIPRGDGPTVTLCHDGVTGCGLYLALSFLLERMAVERECDVCLAVRAVRRSRPDFVQPLEHLEYLYDAAITYLEYFETYANFS